MKKFRILLLCLIFVSAFLIGCDAQSKANEKRVVRNDKQATVTKGEASSSKKSEGEESKELEVLGTKQAEGLLTRNDFELFGPYIEKVDELLSVPLGFTLKEIQSDIQQNGEDVVRLRYTKEGEAVSLFGEHFSVVLGANDQRVLGFITLTSNSEIENDSELPSEEETAQITEAFLANIAPGYFSELSHSFTSRHDELLVLDEEERVVVGMKYKAYVPKDDDYTWIIVNKDREVISFEREIVTGETSIRGTEKWLHDDYLFDGSLDLFTIQ